MANKHIPVVRSFSRAVAQRIGLFSDRFLGLKRPMGEARLIFEIGRGRGDVGELRSLLGLDSGYLSRLLRSLERQGLVQVVPGEHDRRRRRVLLTTTGHGVWAELDAKGENFAFALLDPLSEAEQERLAQSMAEVETLLKLSSIEIVLQDATSSEAVRCLKQYFGELAERFEGGFDVSRSITASPEETRPPNGAFLVARLDGRAVGCGALKTVTVGVGSIKRMWVDPSCRGLGLGRRLLRALECQARSFGMHTLQLETNRALGGAEKFYRRSGYLDVEPFNDDPYAHFWLEKRIDD